MDEGTEGAKAPFLCGNTGRCHTLMPHPSELAVSQALFQDRKTGKRVIQVGGGGGREDFTLVKGPDGVPYYASLAQLMPCDDKGTPDFDARYEKPEDPEEAIPAPVIDIIETRLNINTATAEEIARRVPGLGYRTAKKLKSLQLSLPGEVFRGLDQLKPSSTRVNWDEIFRQNQIFLG
jgi:hypothetical protein